MTQMTVYVTEECSIFSTLNMQNMVHDGTFGEKNDGGKSFHVSFESKAAGHNNGTHIVWFGPYGNIPLL